MMDLATGSRRSTHLAIRPLLGVVAIASIAVAVLAGCGRSASGAGSDMARVDGGSQALPSDELADWVSYGDVVVIARVDSDSANPEPEDVRQTGEGLLLRTVRMSVLRTLWSRNHSFVAPAQNAFAAWGWFVHGDSRRPMVTRGASRIEPGHAYLMVWTTTGTQPGWTSIGTGSVIPFDDEIAGHGERLGADPHNPGSDLWNAYNAIAGLGADSIVAKLAITKPYPLALKYADLPAQQRWSRVTSGK